MNQIVNTTGYAYHGDNMGDLAGTPTNRKRHTLKVTFITDMVIEPTSKGELMGTLPHLTNL